LLKLRAENATFNGILIGSVVMTEILVSRFDAVSGPGIFSVVLERHIADLQALRAPRASTDSAEGDE
jgi:hypothetical protein